MTGKPFGFDAGAAGYVDTACMPEPRRGALLPGRASDP